VDSLAAAEWYKDRRGSLTIGVVTDGRLAWTRSYGFADMEQRVPATRHTVYRIGSVTKEFTGLMLLQLAEAGKVRLADPVEKYFPEVNLVRGRFPNAPPITLIQLATMRAGLSASPNISPATYEDRFRIGKRSSLAPCRMPAMTLSRGRASSIRILVMPFSAPR
jgi:CubicO group peptidase (beta-lactamase class C family)